jgi:homoserine dehydrogenase
LFDLAEKNGVALLYEASVGAGIPLIKSLNGALLPNALSTVRGIVNGTTNFILSQMAATPGLGYEEVLKEAMRLGYAEPDPTLDVNGGDASHKIAILGAMAFGGDRRASDVVREGITAIDSADFDFARARRHTIKLVAGAYLTEAGVELSVWPTFVSVDHPLGATHGVLNCIEIVGDPMGSMTAIGAGAGKGSTSSGVMGDVMQVALLDDAAALLRSQPLRPNAPRPNIPPKAAEVQPRRYLRVRRCNPLAVEEALGFEALSRRADSIAMVAPRQTAAEREAMLAKLAALGVQAGDCCEIRTAAPTGDKALLP